MQRFPPPPLRLLHGGAGTKLQRGEGGRAERRLSVHPGARGPPRLCGA